MATDSFDGTLTAGQAATAIAEGWRRTAPGDVLRALPLSDGGPGFVGALHVALGGERLPVVVRGPVGDAVPAEVLVVPGHASGDEGPVAYIEASQACGLHVLPGEIVPDDAAEHAPADRMTTYGVGELVAAAADAGARRIVIGLGGPTAIDGGAGFLAALGAGDHELLTRGLAGLTPPPVLDLVAAVRRLAGADLVLASDVDTALVGVLSAWGAHLATSAGSPRLAGAAGSGAGGGLGAAVLALGASRVPGAQLVADDVGLAEAAAGTDLVITGEGTFDWQSLRGKVVTAVARAAQAAAVPVVVVAGQVQVGRRELASIGVDAAYAVAEGPGEVGAALADPAGSLAARSARVAATWSRPPVR